MTPIPMEEVYKMKVLVKDMVKDKDVKYKVVRCDCNRYLFTLKDKKIFINCRRCKREHKIEIMPVI